MSDQFEVTSIRMGGLFGSLLAGVSMIGLGLAVATPAFAQDVAEDVAPPSAGAAESNETAEDEDAIVVTGIRQALENARARKRNADTVIESISQTDIGAFPD